MVSFTVSMLWWLACAIFWVFVIVWTSYWIYRFVKDRVDDKARDKYLDECKEKHDIEIQEAKERISKMQKKNNKKPE